MQIPKYYKNPSYTNVEYYVHRSHNIVRITGNVKPTNPCDQFRYPFF